MPIDFAAIVATFGPQLADQTHPLPVLFDRLGDAVKTLVERSERAERATRAYPIFRYRDGALAVHVDLLGAAPLAAAGPPLGFVSGLEAGGRRFLAGLGWTGTAVRQELALPRLLGVAAAAVGAVVASIDRFRRPGPSMFDDRARRLSDVFGLLVLGYNSLLGSDARSQLLGAARGAAGLYETVERLSPPGAPSAPTGRAAVDLLVERADRLGEGLLAAVVLLPVLGETLAALLHDGALVAKRLILTELARLEAEVHGLRRAAIEGLVDAIGLGQLAQDWLVAARTVVLVDLAVATVVLPSLARSFLDGLSAFAHGVVAWGTWLADLAEKLRAAIDAIMSFDLVGAVLRLALPGWLVSRLPVPRVTVDDLVSFLLGTGAAGVKRSLEVFFDGALRLINAADHLPGVDLNDFYWRVDALAKAFDIVLTRTPLPPPDPAPPPLAGFPDVYDAFLGGGRDASLVASVDAFGLEARGGLRSALGGAATMLDRLGTTFAAGADQAATLGSAAVLRELASDSAAFAERVFGPEADRLRAAAGGPDGLAVAFEQAVANGGFALVGGAIPVYVDEMRQFWETRRPPERLPTSPHILARHGRLGGVRVPRLTVRAAGRTPDAALASLVAARLHDAVDEAYAGGRRQFDRLAGRPERRLRPTGRRPAPARTGGRGGS